MTLDEVIKRYTDNAEYERTHGNLQGCLEFRELADWLKELKQLREQQPCEDCISRKDVLAMKGFFRDEDGVLAYAVPTGNILRLKPVTPTRPTGKWIDIQYFKADDTYYRPKCPFCSVEPKEYSNYCPNCGADMRESEDK